jgi:hypothetical protein
MRKAAILMLGAILLHSILGDFNALNILLLLGGLALAYGLFETPDRFITAAKYPVVVLSLLAGVFSALYPAVIAAYHLRQVLLLLAFYSLGFYLATMESKDRSPGKEAIALSLLMVSASFNCYAAGQPLTIVPLALSAMALLFIAGRARLAIVVSAFCVATLVVACLRGFPARGPGQDLPDLERYVLLGTAFLFFVLSFLFFLQEGDALKMLGFYGFLFLSVHIVLSLTARFPLTLRYEPLLAILLVAPSMAALMKSGRRRA